MTKLPRSRGSAVVRFSGHALGEIILARIAREIGERQYHDGKPRRRHRHRFRHVVSAPAVDEIPSAAGDHQQQHDAHNQRHREGAQLAVLARRHSCLCRLADVERINSHRLGDVFQLLGAEIAHREIEPRFDLAIGVFGQRNSAWFGDAFEARGDIDAVAHKVAVTLLDHIANMNANAELDAPLRRQPGVALDHAVLHLDSATHGVNDATKLDQDAISSALHHATAMRGDSGINQIAPQPSQS